MYKISYAEQVRSSGGEARRCPIAVRPLHEAQRKSKKGSNSIRHCEPDRQNLTSRNSSVLRSVPAKAVKAKDHPVLYDILSISRCLDAWVKAATYLQKVYMKRSPSKIAGCTTGRVL